MTKGIGDLGLLKRFIDVQNNIDQARALLDRLESLNKGIGDIVADLVTEQEADDATCPYRETKTYLARRQERDKVRDTLILRFDDKVLYLTSHIVSLLDID